MLKNFEGYLNCYSLYLNAVKAIRYYGEKRELDFNKIITEAKSKGYRLKKSEVTETGDFKYILHYDGTYYKIGLLDISYSIIDNGENAEVWHLDGEKNAPMIIKNHMGICVIFPFNYHEGKSGVTVIEVA